jgi:hypothetical protein
MADITMCDGKNCDLATTCYRYKAEPSKYTQSYFVEAPIENGQCRYCNLENDNHKLSCPIMKIQVNL